MIQKRFDFCSIIGRSPSMFRHFAANVIENAGLSRDAWNFNMVVYRNSRINPSITDSILKIADDNGIEVHMYDEIEGADKDFEIFLTNLYACWNLCHKVGNTVLSMRAGSDQAFSKNAFKNMLDVWDNYVHQYKHEDLILFHNLIECKENVQQSRHILESFGRDWQTFDAAAFKIWCDKNEQPGLFDWNAAVTKWGAPRNMPGLSSNFRADGASWLMAKSTYKKYGPMPPRYSNGLTGDIGLMNLMYERGVPIYIVGNSTTYHFSQGERNANS